MEPTNQTGTPTQKLIWISLIINILLCCTLLPLILNPAQIFSAKQLLETLLWQTMAIISWPITLISAVFAFFKHGGLPTFMTLIKSLIYPAGMISLVLVFIFKQKGWIPLILTHLLIIASFVTVWLPVINGYDFMIG